jgi:hypothetical protein
MIFKPSTIFSGIGVGASYFPVEEFNVQLGKGCVASTNESDASSYFQTGPLAKFFLVPSL